MSKPGTPNLNCVSWQQKNFKRVQLERELVRQQQQNVILQKQREVDRLEAQVDRQLFQQAQESAAKPAVKVKLAPVREEAERYIHLKPWN